LLGRALTELGRPEEGLPHSARALLLRSGTPSSNLGDLNRLDRQRAALGDDRYARLLRAAVGTAPTERILELQKAIRAPTSL
jgi:hypothetical protein